MPLEESCLRSGLRGGYFNNKISCIAPPKGPLCEGVPAKRVGERTYAITLYPYTWCRICTTPQYTPCPKVQ